MQARQHFTITALIAGCAVVFLLQQTRDDGAYQRFCTIPAEVVASCQQIVTDGPAWDSARSFATLLTATFLHGDIEHLLLNMVFLWVFGTLASQLLGPWWALAVFVLTGVAGSLMHVLLNRESVIPMLGASGAVCGFEGLYLGLAMRWRLDWPDVWPIAQPIPPLQLAAVAVVGLAFDVYGLVSRGHGVAYGAHLGGLATGLLIAAAVTTLFPTRAAFGR